MRPQAARVSGTKLLRRSAALEERSAFSLFYTAPKLSCVCMRFRVYALLCQARKERMQGERRSALSEASSPTVSLEPHSPNIQECRPAQRMPFGKGVTRKGRGEKIRLKAPDASEFWPLSVQRIAPRRVGRSDSHCILSRGELRTNKDETPVRVGASALSEKSASGKTIKTREVFGTVQQATCEGFDGRFRNSELLQRAFTSPPLRKGATSSNLSSFGSPSLSALPRRLFEPPPVWLLFPPSESTDLQNKNKTSSSAQ